jgi:hypothetical protein
MKIVDRAAMVTTPLSAPSRTAPPSRREVATVDDIQGALAAESSTSARVASSVPISAFAHGPDSG